MFRHSNSRILLQFLLVLLAWMPARASTPQGPLGLNSVVGLALERSPKFRSLKAQTEVRRLQTTNALSRLFPSLDISANHTVTNQLEPSSSSERRSFLAASLTASLYDNGDTWRALSVARLRERLAEEQLGLERDRLVLEAVTLLHELAVATARLEVSKKNHAVFTRQFKLVEGLYRQGLKTADDYHRIKAQVKKGEIGLMNDEADVERARQSLLRSLGLEPGSDVTFETAFVAPPGAARAEQEPLTYEKTRQFKLDEFQREIDAELEKQVHRAWWPQLFISASATRYQDGFIAPSDSYSGTSTYLQGQIVMKLNLWDWGVRRRDNEIATLERQSRADLIAEDGRQLQKTLDSLNLEIRQLSRELALQQELLDLYEKSAGSVESEYRGGRATYLELLTTLNDFAAAQDRTQRIQLTLNQRLYTYSFYKGDIYEPFEK